METTTITFEQECQEHLDRFFARWPNRLLQEKSNKALRMLRASSEPLKGKTEGWAAGVIYFAATDGHIPRGVPEASNAEFSAFMGVPMKTARRRSGRVRDIVLI